MFSLRRTLAVRFSITMFLALALIGLWATVAWHQLLESNMRQLGVAAPAAATAVADATGDLIWLMGTIVLLATVATIFGAGWLSRSAMRPVNEITAQARAVAPGTLGQRITAHAHVQEFAALVDVLNAMLDRLDRGVEAQRRLIADAGHDLRTPLTTMQGEIEVALRGDRTPESYRRVLHSVLDDVDQLRAISDALLVLARLDTGLDMHPEPVALTDLVAEAADRWRPRMGDHAIAVAPPAASVTVVADASLLRLALDQLLDNIARHTPDGTTATIRIARGNGAATLTVEDDGPGEAPELLPHLFDRFFRADQARTRGTARAGLGLTVVEAVARAHGGAARAEGAQPHGLRITLSFPVGGSP